MRSKEEKNAYWREWYAQSDKTKHKAKVRRRNARQRTESKAVISEIKKTRGCADCGEDDPIVLEFDHLGAKDDDVSNMVRRALSVKTILAEIDKCEVVCANCHRRRTHNRRQGVAQ